MTVVVNKKFTIAAALAATVVFLGLCTPAGAQDTDERLYVVTHVDLLGPTGAAEAAKMLHEFAIATRNDQGSVRFEVLRDPDRLNHFTIVEVWRTRQGFESHRAAGHAKAFREKLQSMLGSPFDARLHKLLPIGYSASSSSIHPAVRYSGRVPTDPAGTLETEASIIEGAGSQTNGLHRWGDYSSLRIDPADDCTFWYINEYLKSSGAFNWSTGIGSFKFTSCGAARPDAAPVLNTANAILTTEVDLGWTNNATNATGNRILRCTGAACTPSVSIASVAATATTYNDTSAAANTTYGYAIEAFNGSGVNDSNRKYATTPLPPPPTPPTFTSATGVSSTEIDLAWGNNATNATGIHILRCSGTCTPSSSIATLAASAIGYHDTGLSAGQTFSYIIEAYNAGGVGDSAARTATTQTASQLPAAPVLKVGSAGKNSLTLTWTESTPPSVTGFDILRCTGSGCTPTTVVASVASAASTYTDSSLARRTTYTYEVRANNSSGSTLSNSAAGSTH